jgi:co-chaperonin GroES (HSP10)
MLYSLQVKGKFKPLQDWVILQPMDEIKSKGGILLPDDATEYGRCLVVAVGPGYLPFDGNNATYGGHLIKTELKPGKFVYIQKFVKGDFEFSLNGKRVYAIRERHLNLTIEGEQAKTLNSAA